MASKYRVTEQIGKGATSVVYEGVCRKTQEKVAIKVVDSRNRRNLHLAANEIRVLQRLSHPNVIRIIETVETETQTLIVMEKCKFSLSSVAKSGPLPYKTVLRIFRDVLVGLRYLHTNGVIHRDIKLGNVMISEKNDLKIIDFGLSKDTAFSAPKTFCGTPDFISPEMMKRQPYTKKTDIFSAGMLVYFLVFRSDYSRAQVEAGKKSEEYGGLVSLLERMLEKDPGRRISAEEALQSEIFRRFNPGVMAVEGMKAFTIATKLGEIKYLKEEVWMKGKGGCFIIRSGMGGVYEKNEKTGEEVYVPFCGVDTRKLKLVGFCYSILSLVKKRTPVVIIITDEGKFFKMLKESVYVYITESEYTVWQNGETKTKPTTQTGEPRALSPSAEGIKKEKMRPLISEANLALEKHGLSGVPITIDRRREKKGCVGRSTYQSMGVSVESGTLANLDGCVGRREHTPVFIREGVIVRLEPYVYGLMEYGGRFTILDAEMQVLIEYAEGKEKQVHGIDMGTERRVLEKVGLFECMLGSR